MSGTRRAHLLLQVEPGRVEDVLRHVRDIPEVAETAETSGPFDVIVVVLAERELDLVRTLVRVRRAPGLFAVRICRSGAAVAV